MTKWCEICDEYEATHAGHTLCDTCYNRLWNYMKRGPGWVMRRRENLKKYMRTASASMGNVSFIDDKEEVA